MTDTGPSFRPQFGYVPDPDATKAIVAELPRPLYGDCAPTYANDKDVVLYQPLLNFLPNWKRGSQPIGSCVGWGWSLGCDLRAAIEAEHDGEEFGGRIIEAATYGFSRVEARGVKRAGYGDGSYGGAAAKGVSKFGTLHYGRDYGGQTISDIGSRSREKEWGNTGVPDDLEKYAAEHKMTTVSLVRSFDEAAKAIGISKAPVPVCSGQGFRMDRDSDGFCRASGGWSHCMCFIGVRFGSRPGLLCANSWGHSNSGPHYPHDMPQEMQACSFWVEADVADRMLRGEDSFAVSNYDGFPVIDIDHMFI